MYSDSRSWRAWRIALHSAMMRSRWKSRVQEESASKAAPLIIASKRFSSDGRIFSSLTTRGSWIIKCWKTLGVLVREVRLIKLLLYFSLAWTAVTLCFLEFQTALYPWCIQNTFDPGRLHFPYCGYTYRSLADKAQFSLPPRSHICVIKPYWPLFSPQLASELSRQNCFTPQWNTVEQVPRPHWHLLTTTTWSLSRLCFLLLLHEGACHEFTLKNFLKRNTSYTMLIMSVYYCHTIYVTFTTHYISYQSISELRPSFVWKSTGRVDTSNIYILRNQEDI